MAGKKGSKDTAEAAAPDAAAAAPAEVEVPFDQRVPFKTLKLAQILAAGIEPAEWSRLSDDAKGGYVQQANHLTANAHELAKYLPVLP